MLSDLNPLSLLAIDQLLDLFHREMSCFLKGALTLTYRIPMLLKIGGPVVTVAVTAISSLETKIKTLESLL